MQPLTLYIADEDYDKVIQALSFRHMSSSDPANASEEKALEALMLLVMDVVEGFDRQSYFNGFVFNPPGLSAPKPWKQPAGAHDAYNSAVRPEKIVRHGGKVWQSTVPDNVWEPGAYGWIEL